MHLMKFIIGKKDKLIKTLHFKIKVRFDKII